MTLDIKTFFEDDDGAVTVDWVVLTAAIVTVSLLIWPVIQPSLLTASSGITADILSATVF